MFVTLESVFVWILSDVGSLIEQSETGFGDKSNPRPFVVEALVNCLNVRDFLGATRC